MFFIVRLFFIVILTSVVLSMALGWFAIARARLNLAKSFQFKKAERAPEQKGNVIEGEYRIINEKERE